MKNEEFQHQVSLIDWWDLYALKNKLPKELLFSIQNGARTSIGTAKRLKASGGRRGVPDLMLAICHGIHPGLFIEMKRPGGSVSQDQREMIDLLRWQGYTCVVAKGWEEAMNAIKEYLK